MGTQLLKFYTKKFTDDVVLLSLNVSSMKAIQSATLFCESATLFFLNTPVDVK
jgi:hypothetical protein